MRSLGADEAELWARVAATIRPLSREAIEQPAPSSPEPPAPGVAPAPPRRAAAKPAVPRSHSTATLDGSWDRKLGSGSVQPDRVLDLHGRNLDQAWQAIDDTLERAIRAGDRLLLFITGHAPAGAPPVERGKIRAAVHDWLAASRHARHIAVVRNAHRRHGGGGSLYIVLRRGDARRSTLS